MPFPHPPDQENLSYWLDTTPLTNYPPLRGNEQTDVAIVGGGIAGIVAAYLLAKGGKRVVVIDRERIGTVVTGHTTAHLQIVDDTELQILDDRVGLEKAKLAWDGQLEAVSLLEQIVHEEDIDCDFQRLDALLYTNKADEHDFLLEEARLARLIGYEAEEVPADEVPYPQAKWAIRYPDQGKFHVRKFLLALVKKAEALGVRFYEGSNVVEVDSGKPVKLTTEDGHTLTADWLLAMTQIPFHTRIRMYLRLYPYHSYVIGARVRKGVFENRLYWDTEEPGYHYTRVEDQGDHDLVILGGEDRKAADPENNEERYEALESYLRAAAPDAEVVYRWTAIWYETEDGLPYIGKMPAAPDNELIACGFSGTGMTYGTLAALMLTERVLGRGTPWDEVFDPKRLSAGGGAIKEMVSESLENSKNLAKSLFKRSEVDSVADIRPGEGAILRRGLAKMAVSRMEDGTLKACSATCTHAGCTVGWNPLQSSWDCPCHGSRFSPDGEVLHGPAFTPLKQLDASELEQEDARKAERRHH